MGVGMQTSYLKDVFILNLHNMRWSEVKIGHLYPSMRYHMAMAVIQNPSLKGQDFELAMFGGLNVRCCKSEMWKLCINTDTQRKSIVRQSGRGANAAVSRGASVPNTKFDVSN